MQFFVVYLREAHAIDSSWPMGGSDAPIVEDPITWQERKQVARVCMAKLALDPIPALVDDLDDEVGSAYVAHPDRLYLIGKDGNIAYRGGPGPFGFDPDGLEQAIRESTGMAPSGSQ